MSWLTELFCPGLVEENARLRARATYYADRTEQAENLATARGWNEKRQAATITALRDQLAEPPRTDGPKPRKGTRLGRALIACAVYRQQIAADARLIREQQRRLDDALGLNSPDVLAGINWQATREDKRVSP